MQAFTEPLVLYALVLVGVIAFMAGFGLGFGLWRQWRPWPWNK